MSNHIVVLVDESGMKHKRRPRPISNAPLYSVGMDFHADLQDLIYRFHLEHNVHIEMNKVTDGYFRSNPLMGDTYQAAYIFKLSRSND